MPARDIDFRSVLEAMPVGIAFHRPSPFADPGTGQVRPDAEFVSLNPEFERLTGLDPALLAGRRFSLLEPDVRESVRRWMGDVDVADAVSFTRPAVYSERYGTWCRIVSFPAGDAVATLVEPFASGLGPAVSATAGSATATALASAPAPAPADAPASAAAAGDDASASAPDEVAALVTHDLRILDADPHWKTLLGFEPSDVVGRSLLDLVDPDDRASIENLFRIDRTVMTIRVGSRKGEERYFDLVAGARGGSFCVVLKDVTARTLGEKELMRSEMRYRELFEISEDVIFRIDAHGTVLSANRAMEVTFGSGRTASDVLAATPATGRAVAELLSLDGSGAEWAVRIQAALEAGRSVRFVHDARGPDGTPRRYHVSLTPESDEGAERAEGGTTLVAICRDITEMGGEDGAAAKEVLFDPLTGLPNRTLFRDRLDAAVRLADRQKKKVGVLYLDVDNFKSINDTMGHDVGDEVLKELARRFSANLRASDTMARMSGDEFAAILQYVDGPADAQAVVHRLQNCLGTPVVVAGFKHYIGVSIGISLHPENGADAENLLKNADAAMFTAKREGKSRFQYFSDEIRKNLQRRMEMGLVLREALQRGELSLDYQPIVVARSGATRGYEALLRWNSRHFGPVPPSEFIPVAEETGIIVDLGEFVLKQVCEACHRFNSTRGKTIFSINVSPVQFARSDFLKRFRRIVSESGANPMLLEVEITESVLVGNVDAALKILKALKVMGVRIMLDDFGTGYSSLSYLRTLPIDGLKIDRSFVQDITKANEEKVLVGAIILLAHKLGLEVVAEGVEDAVQHNHLIHRDCDFIQGYYLRRPVSGSSLLETLSSPF